MDDVRLEDYLDTREHGNMLLSLRPLQTEGVKAQKAGYGIVDWKYQGVGAVVQSIEKTVKYYRSMGIAQFRPQAVLDTSSIRDVKLHGRSTRDLIKAKTRLMRIGPVAYELIEPVEGEAVFKESLDRRGEGIINLTFIVDDLDRETSKLAEKGVAVIFSGKPEAGKAFAYFDTRKDGGDVMIKLAQG
jgi:methylmalonyl-CoA/ethylmalonyl-CoA epimerase